MEDIQIKKINVKSVLTKSNLPVSDYSLILMLAVVMDANIVMHHL